ncbi:lipase family protein [Pseudomonas entomophila]|uniref:lipase family protein n=1 Tax=Pseudomonas entomophila TaxID=312306 RepID=UPI001BD0E1D3|nr:lipase family protein [Pseudomonas entomophila]QVM89606.1 lipase family protein [Pseudomonas entomophila]
MGHNEFFKEINHPLNNIMLVCPVRGVSTSFQLVDEQGHGAPYAGAFYEVVDMDGTTYKGALDTDGKGEVLNHCRGPVSLRFASEYTGADVSYERLQTRDHYPLKITDIQVRAEQTHFQNRDGRRTQSNPAAVSADEFYQVEVSELVCHICHLPPRSLSDFPSDLGIRRIMGKHCEWGVGLMFGKHTVLEVRPLRALRPVLSMDPEFCALNLYQLALMATLSYTPFGQEPPGHPVKAQSVNFPHVPTVGNWFGDALAKGKEIWRVDTKQQTEYFPLYEDVPYSQRWEIVPFDPELYEQNNPALGDDQENPSSLHFLDDRGLPDTTDTQAFITHNADVMIIAIRGTSEKIPDLMRDVDALQVPFEEGHGKVHRGFYLAAKRAVRLVTNYMDKFYQSQKLIICGHSLGGAIALPLAQMLRAIDRSYPLQLYTYGAPRAGDSTFLASAANLRHHRIVNNDDMVPNLPLPWMNTRYEVIATGAVLASINFPLGAMVMRTGLVNQDGEPYGHHGELQHFMPIQLSNQESSAILWRPGCTTITAQPACNYYLEKVDGLPQHRSVSLADHFMVSSYIPACWAMLRRHQQALANRTPAVTVRELEAVDTALASISQQLRERRSRLSRGDYYPRSREPSLTAIEKELERLQATRERLASLRRAPVSEADVYGSLAGQPQLAEALERWQAHAASTQAAPLAMAPKEQDINVVTFDELFASLDDPLDLI